MGRMIHTPQTKGIEAMKTLYALSESAYTTSVWYLKSLSGLRDAAARQRIDVMLLMDASELDALGELHTLVLIGSDSDWTGFLIESMRKRGVKVVLMGPAPNDFGADVSGALFNRETLVHDMVRYFYLSGRTRLATLGYEPNLVNDNIRPMLFYPRRASTISMWTSGVTYTTSQTIWHNAFRAFLRAPRATTGSSVPMIMLP